MDPWFNLQDGENLKQISTGKASPKPKIRQCLSFFLKKRQKGQKDAGLTADFKKLQELCGKEIVKCDDKARTQFTDLLSDTLFTNGMNFVLNDRRHIAKYLRAVRTVKGSKFKATAPSPRNNKAEEKKKKDIRKKKWKERREMGTKEPFSESKSSRKRQR